MMQKAVIDVSGLRKRGAARGRPKGRQVDPAGAGRGAGAARRRAAAARPADRVPAPDPGRATARISAAHVVALAQEMTLAMTEVYEVATFYHHFDVVKEGETPPPALTVRVCETLSCRLAGSEALHAALERACGAGRARHRRAVHRPLRACAGRRRRPQSGRPRHRRRRAWTRWRGRRTEPGRPAVHRLRGLSRGRRLPRARLAACAARRPLEDVHRRRWRTPACAAWAAPGFPAGRKWRIVRAEPAPRLMAVNIDEGEPGTFKDRHYLERDPHRFLEGMLIAAWAVGIDDVYVYLRDEYAACRAILDARDRGARGRSAVPAAAHPPAPRRRRLHLRRRVGDDRVDRRQARHAAAAPAVRRAGRALRAARRSSTTWRRSTGCATSSRRARRGSPGTAATAARACARSRCRAASRSPACISRRRASPCAS